MLKGSMAATAMSAAEVVAGHVRSHKGEKRSA